MTPHTPPGTSTDPSAQPERNARADAGATPAPGTPARPDLAAHHDPRPRDEADGRAVTGPDAPPGARLGRALAAGSSSVRLQAALAAGSRPDPGLVAALVERCAVEPDFFVRDMLTWALTRHPAAATVPLLLHEVRAGTRQARSQALHALSKIRDARGWDAISTEVLHDPDEDVARTAWRAAVVLVPAGREPELAEALCRELGRGDRGTRRSLSRAIVALGDAGDPALRERERSADDAVRAHALATRRLLDDPDADVEADVAEAQRVAALAAAPSVPDDAPAPTVPGDAPAPSGSGDASRPGDRAGR